MRDFDVEHEKRMHLIVVRRDLTGFQHLHPAQAADGTWTAPAAARRAPARTACSPTSRTTETPRTLAADLRVDGAADLRPLPAPRPDRVSDGGYDVRAPRRAAGDEPALRDHPRRRAGARPSPTSAPAATSSRCARATWPSCTSTPTGDGADASSVEFPTAGRYRLFLQFKHEGRVQTAAFTQEVER